MALPVKTLVAALVAVVVILAAYEIFTLESGPIACNASGPVPSSFTVNGKTYSFTYTATTDAERQAGLMNKKVINTTTMLFVFPSSGKWSFWMYDTNASLDMIWICANGGSGQVVYLVNSAPPCYNSSTCIIYTPTSNANYVIEAKAGFVAVNRITAGTAIQLG
jgi:uncharacterized membrane protein (UPF0127 family)